MTSPPYRRDHTLGPEDETVAPRSDATVTPVHQEAPAAPPGRSPPEGYSSGGEPQAGRPTGVTVLAALAGLVAVLALIGGFTALVGGAAIGADAGVAGGAVMAMGIFLLIYGIFAAAVAWGLFRGARWAWYAAIVLAGLGILNGIISLLAGDILSALVAFLINGLVLWYLLKPDVQEFFGVRHKAPWHSRGRPA